MSKFLPVLALFVRLVILFPIVVAPFFSSRDAGDVLREIFQYTSVVATVRDTHQMIYLAY
jgi:hypothetical protein